MTTCGSCGRDNQSHYKFCLGCGQALKGDDATASSGGGSVAPNPAMASTVPRPLDSGGPAPSISLNIAHLAGGPAAPAGPPTGPDDLPSGARGTSPQLTPPVEPASEPPGPPPLGGGPTVDPAARACPSCGKPVPQGFMFCGSCGQKMELPPPEPIATKMFGAEHAPPVAGAVARGRLVLIRPDGSEGGSHPLRDGENLIGRGVGVLFDGDAYLSPRHAMVTFGQAGAVVEDLGSLNGVFVKITAEEEIQSTDVFRLGQELLKYEAITEPRPTADGTEVMGSPNPGYWGRLSVLVAPSIDGASYPLLPSDVVMGRERGDVVFADDGYVSGAHCRISMRGGRYYLADLGSSNGSFLRIREARVVPTGQFLLMGQQLFRLEYT